MKLRSMIRPAGKTAQAVLRWRRLSFDEAPGVFGNAKPKSGSHLLLQVLNGFCNIMPYRYVQADPIRAINRTGRRRGQAEILADLQRVPEGVIGWGYLDPTPEIVSYLTQTGRINYFIYRDPRDMLVSQVYYATDMQEEHRMHEYYMSLPDFGERLSVAITGIDQDGLRMVSVLQRYESVFQWRAREDVLCIRFEDLIHTRDSTLNAMLDQVEKSGYKIPTARAESIAILIEAIQPGRSRTFRSGKTGGWREHFTDEHKKIFKTIAPDLLVRLGYEKNNNW